MRHSLCWAIGLTGLLASFMNSGSAFAEGDVISPTSQITVTGFRCTVPQWLCSASKEQSRILILRSTQTEASGNVAADKPLILKTIQGFQIVPTDCERKDGLEFIPAKWISSEIDTATTLSPQKHIAVPIQFDLKQVPASGEYSGSLIVEHSEGALAIPVTLKVKDSCHLALPFLVAGVLLAFVLAAYQAEGFDRDEINVKVGQLRSQMQLEVEKTNPEGETAQLFQAKAESTLVDVATALDAKAWIEARKSFSDAQLIWNRWRKQHHAWVDLHEYIKEVFEARIGNEIPAESIYGKDLRFEINRLNRDMADSETPQAFSELIQPLKDKVQPFLDARSEYEKLNIMRTQMGSTGDQWQQPLIDLEDELNKISLDNKHGLDLWQGNANALKEKMEALKSRNLQPRSRDLAVQANNLVRSIPVIQEQKAQGTAQQARWRLQTFRWAGQGVAIALLCGAGFNQLYTANPVFGANPVADYTSLLAWGFTAEVTRDSVAKILQRFRLPGAEE